MIYLTVQYLNALWYNLDVDCFTSERESTSSATLHLIINCIGIEVFKHSLNISAVKHFMMSFVTGMLNIKHFMDTFAVFCYKSYLTVSRFLVTINEGETFVLVVNSVLCIVHCGNYIKMKNKMK